MRFKDAHPHHIKAKYRQYSPTALTNAYKLVVEDRLSVKRASALHGVPVQTLRDRVKGKVDPECVSSGRSPVLDMYEECKIVEHVKSMADFGYGYTMQEVADIATEYAVLLGKRTYNNPLTLKWMEGFRKRWPAIKVSKPRNLDHVRAKMTSEASVNSYFQNLQKALIKHDVLDKPHRIFNVDEKGITLDHKPPHIVSCSDTPLAVTTGRSQTITILGCGSAGGVAIPPYFVFPGKRMLPDLLAGSSPGTNGTVSDSGWSNGLVFRDYLQDHFLKYVPGGNSEPVLLLLDGHKSHVSVGLTEWALQHNIIIFVLPAHTSHILQPMDVAIFGPLQRIYNTLCHKFVRSISATISRYNVCELACKAYVKAFSSDNLQSAFRKSGIHPFDREAIDKTKLTPAEAFETKPSDAEEVSCDQDSQETVEGGVLVAEACLQVRMNAFKKVKTDQPEKKQRKTMSKIVSGKDLSEKDVLEKMRDHEQLQKPYVSTGKGKVKAAKCLKKIPKPAVSVVKEPVAGPSHIRIEDSEDIWIDSDEEVDVIPCCVCEHREPPKELRRRSGIDILDWAQCDGMRNGMPCLHWVHLRYCTSVEQVLHGDKFYCAHCERVAPAQY